MGLCTLNIEFFNCSITNLMQNKKRLVERLDVLRDIAFRWETGPAKECDEQQVAIAFSRALNFSMTLLQSTQAGKLPLPQALANGSKVAQMRTSRYAFVGQPPAEWVDAVFVIKSNVSRSE